MQKIYINEGQVVKKKKKGSMSRKLSDGGSRMLGDYQRNHPIFVSLYQKLVLNRLVISELVNF